MEIPHDPISTLRQRSKTDETPASVDDEPLSYSPNLTNPVTQAVTRHPLQNPKRQPLT